MLHKILLLIQLLLATAYADHQAYPGTSSRPVLSDAEAASYTKESYLQGWTPSKINTGANGDYVVGSGGYSTIQAAVNAAINVPKSLSVLTKSFITYTFCSRTAVLIENISKSKQERTHREF